MRHYDGGNGKALTSKFLHLILMNMKIDNLPVKKLNENF